MSELETHVIEDMLSRGYNPRRRDHVEAYGEERLPSMTLSTQNTIGYPDPNQKGPFLRRASTTKT